MYRWVVCPLCIRCYDSGPPRRLNRSCWAHLMIWILLPESMKGRTTEATSQVRPLKSTCVQYQAHACISVRTHIIHKHAYTYNNHNHFFLIWDCIILYKSRAWWSLHLGGWGKKITLHKNSLSAIEVFWNVLTQYQTPFGSRRVTQQNFLATLFSFLPNCFSH